MKIIIDFSGDSFGSPDGSACVSEIARILEIIVKQAREDNSFPNKLYDRNGNYVGSIYFQNSYGEVC